jgi:ferritin-like metal-binding protein YciE
MTGNEEIRENLTDILGFEQQALERIERQARDERVRKFENAYEALEKIEAVLHSHIRELERHLSTLDGGFEARLKKAATSIAGSFAGIYDRLRTNGPVSKSLRDDYALLNLAVISYGMLNTAALAFAETQIASMAERHMNGLTPLIVELSDIIPFVFAGELAGKGRIEDGAVAQQAAAQYRQAWRREVTMKV